MPVAVFDLDNTLIGGDASDQWMEFMVERGIARDPSFLDEHERFMREYASGGLDIAEYMAATLAPLAGRPREEVDLLVQDYVEERVAPMRLPKADELLKRHRDAGDRLLLLTASNALIAEPVGRWLGIEAVLSIRVEVVGGRITGRILGTPTYREGKVEAFHDWLAAEGMTAEGSTFYSDSHNDLPLLDRVDRPVAVDPDPALARIAAERGWPILSLR